MKIYSWEELENGAYASPESLALARKEALDVLTKLYAKGWIASGLVFGSVARGDYGVGSDLDILIISNPRYRKSVQRVIQQAYSRGMENLHVSPQVVHFTTEEARNGTHTITPTFLHHLLRINPDNLVGVSPEKILSLKGKHSFREAVRQIEFLGSKVRKNAARLAHEKSQHGEAYYKLLGQSVDSTINATRRVMDISGDIPRKGSDAKQNVIDRYQSAFEPSQTRTPLWQIMEARNDYQKALTKGLHALESGRPAGIQEAHMGYSHALHQLEKAVHSAEAFFTGVSPLVRHPRTLRIRRAWSRTKERFSKRFQRRTTHP